MLRVCERGWVLKRHFPRLGPLLSAPRWLKSCLAVADSLPVAKTDNCRIPQCPVCLASCLIVAIVFFLDGDKDILVSYMSPRQAENGTKLPGIALE
jgi:hypothetical protein